MKLYWPTINSKKIFFVQLILITCIPCIMAQIQIEGSFAFESDPAKKYAIVIPTSYTPGTSSPAFLALHPLNTSRWNAATWCAELSDFAETNQLLLICPDGGADGRIDDPIDTAFTSRLLDSAFVWYDIDPHKLYVTGFSWGGRTTYTYGLNHIDKFAGLMPIGAAVSTTQITGIEDQADGVPVYIIHGRQDIPTIRYFPMRQSMIDHGACVDGILLDGVGHTIDFKNRVSILTDGYHFLQSNDCITTATKYITPNKDLGFTQSIYYRGSAIRLNDQVHNWELYDMSGMLIKKGHSDIVILDTSAGLYFIKTPTGVQRIVVL